MDINHLQEEGQLCIRREGKEERVVVMWMSLYLSQEFEEVWPDDSWLYHLFTSDLFLIIVLRW